MEHLPDSLLGHRIQTDAETDVIHGEVHWEPVRSLWFTAMAAGAAVGGIAFFSWPAFLLFLASTALVLLLGHSLGMHRKLIHDSFQCPKWLEYLLVYAGIHVGLSGPLGLLRTHELRDYAQRRASCHDFFGHRRSPLVDAWWQLHCRLVLRRPPAIHIEPGIAEDRFYRFLQRTWMLHHLPVAMLFFALGGWGFVFWGVCARVTAGVGGHWLIGHLAHRHGHMHHVVDGASVQGRNVRFSALLTMGECWHNNHHAFPGSAKLGLFPGEWDPGWWFLRGLARVGLAWDLKTPRDLPARDELRALHVPPNGKEPYHRATMSSRWKIPCSSPATPPPPSPWPAIPARSSAAPSSRAGAMSCISIRRTTRPAARRKPARSATTCRPSASSACRCTA